MEKDVATTRDGDIDDKLTDVPMFQVNGVEASAPRWVFFNGL